MGLYSARWSILIQSNSASMSGDTWQNGITSGFFVHIFYLFEVWWPFFGKEFGHINILTHQSLLSTVAGSCVWSLISFFARLLRPIFFLKCWYGQTRSWFLDKSKLDRKLAASALKKMAVSARTLPILGCFGQSWAKPGCFGQITGCFGKFFL